MTHPRVPKPRAEISHPELVRLPRLSSGRCLARKILIFLTRVVVWLFVDLKITGRENIPDQGPLLIVSNHLGDADAFIGLGVPRVSVEIVAKIELYAIPILGALMSAYGVIWIHRGQADRRAIRVILEALAEGRVVALAPEGRESVTGGLEEGTEGAAYLAVKANVPILPVTFTGTRNEQIYTNLKRMRRSHVNITIGPVFHLPREDDWRAAVHAGTTMIMQTLARQLPIDYQGVYKLDDNIYRSAG
jgi:1-acyl-sn-glycerol-3-phosphate acyltransferase